MKQQESLEKPAGKQEKRIQEMEQAISLLEEENDLQRQLIGKLREENRMLEKHAQECLDTMRRMLKDIDIYP